MRLEEAERLLDDPSTLAEEFAATVERFAPYRNDEPFYPSPRKVHKPGTDLKRTYDLVLQLPKAHSIEPRDSEHRLHDAAQDSQVADVVAADLGFTYVDKELLVHRTTSKDKNGRPRRARWGDDGVNRGGMRLDILLANANDRAPIIAELKIRQDMDPFFALVQALGCAAHLVTHNQYERLRAENLDTHASFPGFREARGDPFVDVYLLFVGADAAPRGRYQPALKRAAEQLAPKLLEHTGIAKNVRRIVGLDMDLDGKRRPVASVRFAYERPSL
jgi:hypothetical protein